MPFNFVEILDWYKLNLSIFRFISASIPQLPDRMGEGNAMTRFSRETGSSKVLLRYFDARGA